MEIAFVELGSYSVKFLRGVVERRVVQYLHFQQKTIRAVLPQLAAVNEEAQGVDLQQTELIELAQFKLIEDYLGQNPSVEKVIINLPSHHSILRFISLPIKGKKKIERMLPFQLEDGLPYPISKTHLAFHPVVHETGSYVIALATHVKTFGQFYQKTRELSCHPAAIVGSESIYQTFVSQYGFMDSMAIIDLGHYKSTCHLFDEGKLVGVESSFVCGQIVDEAISRAYQIDLTEAIVFKHKNSFFLTEEQFAKADQDQKNFSQVMEETFSGLVDDFKRWHIGYQLKSRKNLKRVLITGGMSNIKNIDYFLSREFGVPTSHFNYWQQTKLNDLALDQRELRSLASCHGLSYHLTVKNGLSDFCSGEFATSESNNFPLTSISFVGVRVAMACLALFIALVVENIYISKSDKKITKELSKELKDPLFAITPRERRRLQREPEKLFSSLRKKGQKLKGQIAAMEEISHIDAIGPLEKLSQDVDRSQNVELVSFENQNKNVLAVFKSDSFEILQTLERLLRSKHSGDEVKITLKKEEKMLELSYNDI